MSAPLEHDYIGLSEASSMEKPSKSSNISSESDNKNVLNLKATELRLGLPGLGQDLEENACKNSHVVNNIAAGGKRGFFDVSFDGSSLDGKKKTEHSVSAIVEEKKKSCVNGESCRVTPVAAKAQVVGWPPIRSFRKNTMAPNLSKNGDTTEGNSVCGGCLYVKVSMDGAPYLRKVDLKTCKNYTQLSNALEKMFHCFTLGQCSSIRGKEGLSESNLKDLLHRNECVLTYEDKDGDWMLVGDVPWEMFVDSCKRLRIMKGSEAIGLAPRLMVKCKNRIKGI
ncbi:putative transcription factor interactor and regulator AUX-IAA family [Helianthus annuus]|nr:putative transcription factor interactor and regulator AUX-IAA family [Helianthus annuus]